MTEHQRGLAAPTRYINPAVLSRINNLQLIAKTVVEGFITGLHRSPYHGFSLDFAEYREYTPGDDVRSVDWKVYGRTDRFYVKKFEGETNLQLFLLLDCSRSMDFSSHAVSKLEYARYLCASLAYFALRQKDATGLITFDAGIAGVTPPRASRLHFLHILTHLESIRPGAQTDISGSLKQLERLIRKRSLVVLISDFYQESEQIAKSLRFFHHRGNDVILFHVLDPAELELPFERASTLEDMETGESLSYFPEYSRQAYLELLQSHIETLRRECRSVNIDYEVLDTGLPLDQALHRYLSSRGRKL